jgi:RecA/RadA recombinase
MEDYDKFVLGDDRTPHLDSPFGNLIHKPHYVSLGHNIDKRDLKKEEQEIKQREEEAENLFSGLKVVNCKEKLQEKPVRLSTGCRYLDEFLGGGFPAERLIEIFGDSGTGKTQFAIQLLLNSVLPERLGGLGGKALYVFTQKHVSEKRYNEIKDYFLEKNMGNITSDEIDQKVLIMEALKLEDYNIIFGDIHEKIKEENIKLILIDNIASV